jgi:tetratricopeptide (TPR) repeat protein
VARRPGLPLALLRLGYALESTGKFDEALACYDRALEAEPGNVQAHVNRATLNLLRGDFERGWEEYEWRLREPLYAPLHARFALPQWDGTPLKGRSILVYAEQGLGDEIMYASCLNEVIASAGRVVIDCEPRLAPLYRRSFPQATIHAGAQNDPADWLPGARPLDLKVALASLPFHLKRRAGSFPRHSGYLKADPARVQHWKAKLGELGPGMKVGLSWRGGVPKTGRALRSLDLEQLLPVLRQPLHFVSLQYGDSRAELTRLRQMHRITVQQWPEAIDDYDETAALVCALDLVISVCTSAVHLAGALGRPVWVLAPLKPEARYGLAGESMPWYPSARLFRQAAFGDWRPVVARVAAELEKSK